MIEFEKYNQTNIIKERETPKRSALFDPIALIATFDMNHVMNG